MGSTEVLNFGQNVLLACINTFPTAYMCILLLVGYRRAEHVLCETFFVSDMDSSCLFDSPRRRSLALACGLHRSVSSPPIFWVGIGLTGCVQRVVLLCCFQCQPVGWASHCVALAPTHRPPVWWDQDEINAFFSALSLSNPAALCTNYTTWDELWPVRLRNQSHTVDEQKNDVVNNDCCRPTTCFPMLTTGAARPVNESVSVPFFITSNT